jgi:hypothetical protein
VILLFTDFGRDGPYVGEVIAVLRRMAPEVPVVDLVADAAPFRPDLAAHLLVALAPRSLLPGDVLMGVVDPGVGGDRTPIALRLDQRWLVGPDNGLFELMLRRAGKAESYAIAWRPEILSASFHGRDLFAPVAARLARGNQCDLVPVEPQRFPDWPDDLAAIVYLDRYGNAVTGLRAESLATSAVLRAGGRDLRRARTFGDVPPGEPFWYVNSSGLIEIACNGTSAAARLNLTVGTAVAV